MVTFEEVRNKISARYDIVTDLGDAWSFSYDEAEHLDGGDQGYIVLKSTGKILRPYEYYFKDAAMS